VASPPNLQVTYPRPRPLNLYSVSWRVFSDKQIPEVIRILKKKALMCVDAKGYENMAKNMSEFDRYIRQLQALIEAYENGRSGRTGEESSGSDGGGG